MTDNATVFTAPDLQAPTVPPGAAAALQAAIRAALDDPNRYQFSTDRQDPVRPGASYANR